MKIRQKTSEETKRISGQVWVVLVAALFFYIASYFWVKSNSCSNASKIHPSSGIRPMIFFGISGEALGGAMIAPDSAGRERVDLRSKILWWIYSPMIMIDQQIGESDIGAGIDAFKNRQED